MKKLYFSLLFSLIFTANVFAYFDESFIRLLNPDPYSQALGGSILAQSPSVFGLIANPAANYKTISNELQLSYTSVYSNNYGINAGFVFPTEKYGNFSVVVSGFDFNKDIDVTEYDKVYMLALNYVFPFIEKYPIFTEKGSAGINLKYYNIKTKDDSAGIFNIDLGLIYSLDFIDRNLTGAFAVKNIGNDIEHDYVNGLQECSREKQHSGFSAALKYFLSDEYKVSLICEMVKDWQITDLGYAAGIEFVPVEPLTIRIGWRDDRNIDEDGQAFNKGITAGFSLDIDRINLAYAFSDIYGSDDDIHVFSLGTYIGRIPDASRAYEHYLGYYMNKAKNEYSKKNYISARKQFEEILSVYPNEPVAKKYLQILSEDLYNADAEKNKKIDKYLARADVAVLRNNLIRAKSYYSKVLVLENTNVQAKEGLAKVEEELAEQLVYAERKKHAKEIAKYWTDAMVHFNKGEFVFAKEDFNKIIEIDPTNAGALQYLEFIEKKVKKVNRVQANELYKQGMEFFKAKDYAQALKYFNAAYVSDNTRDDIKEYIAKCEEQVSLAKNKDEAAYRAKSSEKAARQEKLKTNKEIETEITSVYNAGIEQYNKGNYQDALVIFNRVSSLSDQYKFYNYNEAVKSYIKKCGIANSKVILTEAKDLELKEDFVKAYDKYNEVLKYNPDSSESKTALQRLSAVLAQRYYEQGIQAFTAGNKEEAVKCLEESLKYDDKKTETKKALERIKK